MKKWFIFFALIISTQSLFAQNDANQIIGTWLTGSGQGKIEIYKNGAHYQGKIVWISEPIDPVTNKPKTDTKHPDSKLHTRPILGLVNLWGFSYNEKDNSWEHGYIYDPKNGKEYKCIITSKDKNTLNVRGYIGISLIGRTDVWTRVK